MRGFPAIFVKMDKRQMGEPSAGPRREIVKRASLISHLCGGRSGGGRGGRGGRGVGPKQPKLITSDSTSKQNNI